MKKLLILTLGTGQPQYVDTKEKGNKEEIDAEKAYLLLKKGEYNYRNALYQLGNEKIKAPFIGEALISTFNPDEIVIIGTICSMWTALYYRYSENIIEEKQRKEDFDRIWEITNNNNGYKTSCENLDKAQDELNTIMGHIGLKIHIILVEYGPQENEIQREISNYDRMRHINGVIGQMKDNEVEIAFDITHCFRSIPIYTLAVLNYIKALGNSQINISHVYYGNLDINRECNNVSPVENLNYLTTLMDLAGAINTFRETGNARNLIDEYKKLNEDKLVTLMSQYEWATQSNDFDQIVDALIQLTELKDISSNPIVRDAQEMIATILKREFDEVKAPKNTEEKTILQYKLACWYHKQHRYGLALATGLEAYRGVFVQLLKVINTDNEVNRRNAIAKLGRVAAKTENKWLKQVNTSIESVKTIRNVFAHCLDGTNDKLLEYKNAIHQVDMFFEIFNDFMKMRMEDGKSRHIYEEEYSKKTTKKRIDLKQKSRFVISENYLKDIEDEFSESNNNTYQVSQISEEEYEEIRAIKPNSKQISLICKTASELLRTYDVTTTIILNINSTEHIVQYIMGLKYYGVKQEIQIYNNNEKNYIRVRDIDFKKILEEEEENE